MVKEIATDKAPRPFDFQPFFFQYFWYNVWPDVVKAIRYVFHLEFMPKCWKDTFITLIPKRSNPMTISDYRPISLCIVVYKMVAKILVNRMKPILPALISNEQGAFVPEHSIVKNILIN